MPCLHKIVKDCDIYVIKAAVNKYCELKKWRWNLKRIEPSQPDNGEAKLYGAPPKKIRKVEGVMNIDDSDDDDDYKDEEEEKEENDNEVESDNNEINEVESDNEISDEILVMPEDD